jgi:hypothetical protein
MVVAKEVGCCLRAVVLFLAAALLPLQATTYYVNIAGIGGEPDYEQRFATLALDANRFLSATPDSKVYTLHGAEATRAKLRSVLQEIAKLATADDSFVLLVIGHGSFDNVDYKINLPGPDITAIELASLLDRIPGRQLVVNTTSASGASFDALRKENRAVITATKSGTERNATVFARYWVEALRDPGADADKNEIVTALEAYRYADQKTAQFYETAKRLATEHALLEDTGQGEGVRAPGPDNGQGLLAARFSILRLGAAQKAVLDPEMQKLLAKKEALEQKIDQLKYRKAAMPTSEYKTQLTQLLLELARTQKELDGE